MFTIGDFATLGRVSVRMLHHYDALGLLRPARVDPSSSYRFYTADQLSRLNRIIALKDLGFTLSQVREILDEKVDVAELRGMLRLRRAQLAERLESDAARLTRVEARLRMIETEGHMNTADVVVKSVPAQLVAELSAIAASYAGEHIGPTLSPLYPELIERMNAAGLAMTGAPLAYYEPAPEESAEAVRVHAAFPIAAAPTGEVNVDIVTVAAIESAATLIHHGAMENAGSSVQVLARWIDDGGYQTDGFAREVYLDYYPERADEGVTELQLAIHRP